MSRKTVVIGLVGSTLDAGLGPKRWTRWRPSVAICQQKAFRIDRLELLVGGPGTALASTIAADIAEVSPETEVRQHAFAPADPWDFSEVYAALDDFAERYSWKASEDYYLHITTGTHVIQICLFLLCETRAIPAQLLQSSPAQDIAGRVGIIDLELSKFDRLAARFRARQARGASLLKQGIATRNARFNAMIDELEHVASRSTDPILLTGETGTGKTALCQRIYELKRVRQRLAGELVAVNCATLRGDLAMSVLFGHAKGAFTGASEARTGMLRKADGGLVFLDEIGELGADEQAMLLSAIEERVFYPVGSDKQATSDFQLVCGTNRDLGAAVRAGAFREDLLARISLWPFHLPPLRERPEDLTPNLDHELARVAAALGGHVSFSRTARDAFLAFAQTAPWAANFRDFHAAIRRMATLADGGRIDLDGVNTEIARQTAQSRRTGQGRVDRVLGAKAQGLDRFDRVQLEDVLGVCATAPSLSAAGRELFAHSLAERTTRNDADRLRKYLARFGLSFEACRAG